MFDQKAVDHHHETICHIISIHILSIFHDVSIPHIYIYIYIIYNIIHIPKLPETSWNINISYIHISINHKYPSYPCSAELIVAFVQSPKHGPTSCELRLFRSTSRYSQTPSAPRWDTQHLGAFLSNVETWSECSYDVYGPSKNLMFEGFQYL